MKTDKVSFGTKPMIGDISGTNGLLKCRESFTTGLSYVFKTLSQNGIDDQLAFNFGIKQGAKKKTTDTLEILYFAKDENKPTEYVYKSSMAFSPKTLEKFSKKKLLALVLDTYEKLKKSTDKSNSGGGYPMGCPRVSKRHQNKIAALINSYGFDDWTCA